MARFRKIDPRIWNDDRFGDLSDRGKLVFFFILTHPHMTALGAFRSSLAGLAVELRWSRPKFRKAFGEVHAAQMVEFCTTHSAISVPNFMRYNRPESPNVVKSWGKAGAFALESIPECSIKTLTIERAIREISTMTPAFKQSFPPEFSIILERAMRKTSGKSSCKTIGMSTGMTTLNREKETEKEKETESDSQDQRDAPKSKSVRSRDSSSLLPLDHEREIPDEATRKLERELGPLLSDAYERKRKERRRR